MLNEVAEVTMKPWDIAAAERKDLQKLELELEAARAEYQALVDKAARWRKLVWAGALAFSGTQLAVISRLTYFDLDWDTMEPISYFLGSGTSLLFFAYMLRHSSSIPTRCSITIRHFGT